MTTRAGLRTWLGISDGHITKWLAIGFPKAVKCKYDKMKVALWLDMTPSVSKGIKIIARKYLSEQHAKKADPGKKKPPAKISTGKKGIKEAVERLRQEELDAHDRYMAARSIADPLASTLLEEWQSSCEFLSKAEPTLLKFLKESGDLAPVVEFKKWMTGKISILKSAFLNIPAKVAPTLEGLPWAKIQKILEEEMGAAFDKLSE